MRCIYIKAIAYWDWAPATHLILEHLDFGRTCDQTDLKQQIESMIDKKLLEPVLAQAVDLEAISWLMSTELGQSLRRNARTLRREVSVYYPQTSAGSLSANDPMDRVMVRGRIDVLIPDSNGLIIADFKTDQLTPQTVDARAEFYRPQIMAYRDAIAAISGRPVVSAQLVFLAAKMIREV